MITRILAAAAAVAMVVGALAVKGRLGGDVGDRSTSDAGPARLVCATELAEVCEALAGPDVAVTVEPVATTTARLRTLDAADAGLDGWLVIGPAATVLDREREARGDERVFGRQDVVARSPLVAAVTAERAAALEKRCPGPEWRCVGEIAPQQWAALGGQPTWGGVKLGHPDPATGVGTVVLAAATAGFRGNTEFDRLDLEADVGYQRWLSGVERARVPNGSMQTLLAARGSVVDIWLTTEAEALTASRGVPSGPVLLYPRPVATADVVFIETLGGGRRSNVLATRVQRSGVRALAALGWRTGGRQPQGLPPTPPSNGLPEAGVVDAIRSLAEAAAR